MSFDQGTASAERRIKTKRSAKTKKLAAASSPPPSLAELQDLMQQAIVSGDDRLLAHLRDGRLTTRDTLLDVYRHAYRARLVDVMRTEHPLLAEYIGEDAFLNLAHRYIELFPSTWRNARWFASSLPEMLATTQPYSTHPQLAELARLERALSDAFDAMDAPPITVDTLVAFPPEHWGSLCFTPHPSAQRLNMSWNTLAIWRALQNEQSPPDATLAGPVEQLIVWRHGVTSKVRALLTEEAMLWDEASRGVSFAILCEMAAVYDEPDVAPQRVAGYLQGWITADLLSGAKLCAD